LGELGFHCVIYPGAITRSVVPAAREMLAELKAEGTTAGRLDRMATFQDVNEVVRLTDRNEWEAMIATRARGAGA
jgi:2-methylisocitrate lyase-like PEP mutase family enzyme